MTGMFMRKRFPLLYSVYNKIRRDIHLVRLRKIHGADNARAIFGHYFENNLFGDDESLSGTGSSLQATQSIRTGLPAILERVGAKSVLDIPCGDFFWAREIDWSGIEYVGAEIVPALVERNSRQYGDAGRRFVELDILKDALPPSDVILCRDLFIHFPNELVLKAIENIKRSKSRYLLTTHCAKVRRNRDIALGSFRPLNLGRAPFFFPNPVDGIADDDYIKMWGRTLSLWRIDDLP